MRVRRWFRVLPIIVPLVALTAAASALMARATPPPEAAPVSGGVVPQLPNCSADRQDDPRCLPGGPGGTTGQGQSVVPPIVPPETPPPIPPLTPPTTPPAFPFTPQPVGPHTKPPEAPHSAPYIAGWAKASLHIKDENQDVTYESDRSDLIFWKRTIQDMPGSTQYVIGPVPTGHGSEFRPLSMTWTGKGRVGDCTVEGKATVTFPIDVDPDNHGRVPGMSTPLDPTRAAYGYLNVVGPDGGDFHIVMIKAFDPDARLTKTCPGNPPTVTEDLFEAGWPLHILWRKNVYEEDWMILSGMQVFDEGKPDDFLNLLPPGTPLPDIARQALGQASTSGTSRRYIWEWMMFPFSGFGPTSP